MRPHRNDRRRADPLSNSKISFDSKDEAQEYCERNGAAAAPRCMYSVRAALKYYVVEPADKKWIKKSYGDNFHWFKNTRVNTK